jgi:hypothetical protein
VAIKNEDIYVGAVYVSLDGMKSWLDLILKLIKMKIDDCYIIKGVRKILVNGIEIKESNQIPNANLDSITAVCVLDELGVFFFFKCVVISLYLLRVKVKKTRDGRRMDRRRRTIYGRRNIYGRRTIYGRKTNYWYGIFFFEEEKRQKTK